MTTLINVGDRIAAHGNLNKRCGSASKIGKGNDHKIQRFMDHAIVLSNATFSVGEKGHQTILNKGQRGVVAWVRGTVESIIPLDEVQDFTEALSEVTYNPVARPELAWFHLREDHSVRIDDADLVVVVTSMDFDNRTRTKTFIVN